MEHLKSGEGVLAIQTMQDAALYTACRASNSGR